MCAGEKINIWSRKVPRFWRWHVSLERGTIWMRLGYATAPKFERKWGALLLEKWMRHRSKGPKPWGLGPWGIQTGPFATCWTDFVHKFFQLPNLYTGEPNFYYPRDLKMRKMDSLKIGWDTGVFKLDYLQPVELILFQKMSTFLQCLP